MTTLPLVLVLSCLTLSCHANRRLWCLDHVPGTSIRPKTHHYIGPSHRVRLARSGRRDAPPFAFESRHHFLAAFLSTALKSSGPARRNNKIYRAVVDLNSRKKDIFFTTLSAMFGSSHPTFTSCQRRNQSPRHRRRVIHFSVSSNENGEEDQREMEEAFASLQALSVEDLIAESEKDARDDNENASSKVKYSRTDDTPLSDTGKSTTEEVELYLEMQGELEGTASLPTQREEKESNPEELPWISINPILRLRGPVASGYGRGGKKLGVPTANLPASLFQSALEDMANGVYFGWAVIEQQTQSSNNENLSSRKGRNTPIKAVVNVGYSPTFEGKENKEKIVEAHLITKCSPMEKNYLSEENSYEDGEIQNGNNGDDVVIEGDFYKETMRLQLIGYLRHEQKFDSFQELINQIHRDIGNAHWALNTMPFIFSKEDEFIKDGFGWIGSYGGDEVASWEYESW